MLGKEKGIEFRVSHPWLCMGSWFWPPDYEVGTGFYICFRSTVKMPCFFKFCILSMSNLFQAWTAYTFYPRTAHYVESPILQCNDKIILLL